MLCKHANNHQSCTDGHAPRNSACHNKRLVSNDQIPNDMAGPTPLPGSVGSLAAIGAKWRM